MITQHQLKIYWYVADFPEIDFAHRFEQQETFLGEESQAEVHKTYGLGVSTHPAEVSSE